MALPFQVIFLGTGVSTAIPSIRHVLDMDDNGKIKCPVCSDAYTQPGSKNRRNNVSIAIAFNSRKDGQRKCVMIDAGKTMRDAVTSQFPKHNIHTVNALLITHGHADAILGLDDLRDLQQSQRVRVPDPADPENTVFGFRILSGPLPIYLTEETNKTVCDVFPYLTNPPKFLDEATNVLERRVACIRLCPVPDTCTLDIDTLPVHCFPTYHGGTYVSLGFHIGTIPGDFVYISDVKIIPAETLTYLKSLPRIKTFVIDCLDREGIWSHLGLEEAIAICQELNPETVYFTGMCCGLGLHEGVEAELQARGLTNYFLAYDGLTLDFAGV